MNKKVISENISAGVKITTYDDGSQHFELVEQPNQIAKVDSRNWWQRLKDWWTNAPIRPYAKIRDLADPFGDRDDLDAGSDGKKAAEIGIQIRF